MRILHTADWHWGDRLERFDRTADIRRVVEQIAGYCDSEHVDVLLVAGDLFSEVLSREGQRAAIEEFNKLFRPFLARNGTIVAITGNHDSDVFCRTLREAFLLASPSGVTPGREAPRGRFHLATGPTFFKLNDDVGATVQFALMPYPYASRYLDDEGQRYNSGDERRRRLADAFQAKLALMEKHLDPALPSVLAAHIYVQGASLGGPKREAYKLSEDQDIVFREAAVPTGWAYTALGHIHQAQTLSGLAHVRYSGSPERLDMGERHDEKGCVVFDVGRDGRSGEPQVLPLDASPFYELSFKDVEHDLKRLADLHPDHERAYVKLRAIYRPGEHDPLAIEREIRRVFPRCYCCELTPFRHAVQDAGPPFAEASGETLESSDSPAEMSVPSVVRRYLQETIKSDDPDREALLALADEMLEERS